MMRKKMYKSGKNWLFAGVAIAAFLTAGSGNSINPSADEISQSEASFVKDFP